MTIKTTKLPVRSTKEIKDYNHAVAKGMESYFVVQNGKGWYVRKASSKAKNATLFATKTEAIKNAKTKAAKRKSEVIIFNNKGALLDRHHA